MWSSYVTKVMFLCGESKWVKENSHEVRSSDVTLHTMRTLETAFISVWPFLPQTLISGKLPSPLNTPLWKIELCKSRDHREAFGSAPQQDTTRSSLAVLRSRDMPQPSWRLRETSFVKSLTGYLCFQKISHRITKYFQMTASTLNQATMWCLSGQLKRRLVRSCMAWLCTGKLPRLEVAGFK